MTLKSGPSGDVKIPPLKPVQAVHPKGMKTLSPASPPSKPRSLSQPRSHNRAQSRALPQINQKPMRFALPPFPSPKKPEVDNKCHFHQRRKARSGHNSVKHERSRGRYIHQKRELMRKQFIINCFANGNLSEEERKLIIIYSANLF